MCHGSVYFFGLFFLAAVLVFGLFSFFSVFAFTPAFGFAAAFAFPAGAFFAAETSVFASAPAFATDLVAFTPLPFCFSASAIALLPPFSNMASMRILVKSCRWPLRFW